MEQCEISEKYERIAGKVISEHADLDWISKSDVSIGYLISDKEKSTRGGLVFAECIRVKAVFRAYIPHDFLIVVYEPNVEWMSEAQLEILIYHELLHVDITVNGKGETAYMVRPHDVEDFRVILEKYGLGWADKPGKGGE